MRRAFLGAFLALSFALSCSATIHVVNNSNTNPGQFSSLQAAIDAATDGDTLHIQPSPSGYGDCNLNKALTLLGIGHRPQKDLPLIASIGTITLGQFTNNVVLEGLKMTAFYLPCQPYGVWSSNNGVTVRFCDVGNFGANNPNNCYGFNALYNVVFENNIIRGLAMPGVGDNALFQNNIIYTYAAAFGAGYTDVLVKNNLFLYDYAVSNVHGTGIVFENNIFVRASPASMYFQLENCIFNNNLTYQTNNDAVVGGTNTGTGNIVSQDPLFVNFNLNQNPFFNLDNSDFRLQDLSPGKNAGTDGTDLGPYGNNMEFSETGEGTMRPVIRQMNILNSTVPSSGTIQVQIMATQPWSE